MKPGSTFRGTEIRPAGHIFYVPPEERPGNDPKDRPHFLVNRCDPTPDPWVVGTLAHMSTKSTEMTEYGCAGHAIPALPYVKEAGRDGNFIISARLLPRLARDLSHSRFSATDEVRSVRRSVANALGIDEGLAPRGSGSVRGRLARILDNRADFDFGLVLTAHQYSAQRRFQIVVPIIDRVVDAGDGIEELEITPWDVLPDPQAWLTAVDLREPMIETVGLLSLTEEWRVGRDSRGWLGKQMEITSVSVDATTLAGVEAKILERFRL